MVLYGEVSCCLKFHEAFRTGNCLQVLMPRPVSGVLPNLQAELHLLPLIAALVIG